MGLFKKNKNPDEVKVENKKESSLVSELRREMLDESPYNPATSSSVKTSASAEIQDSHKSVDEPQKASTEDLLPNTDENPIFDGNKEEYVLSFDSDPKQSVSHKTDAKPHLSNLEAFFAPNTEKTTPQNSEPNDDQSIQFHNIASGVTSGQSENPDDINLPHRKAGLSNRDLLWIYSKMIECRLLDEEMSRLSRAKKAPFTISSRGQEASQVAFAAAINVGHDFIVPYYRDLGIVTTLGMTPLQVLLALLGKGDDPNSGGRQMPNHWSSPELRIISSSSLIANHMTHGVGIALGLKNDHKEDVVFVTFSSAAITKGEFHEALNFTALKKLPIVFLCEDNGSSNFELFLGGNFVADITRRCNSYGIHLEVVDSLDPISMYAVTSKAKTRAKTGEGATIIVTSPNRLLTSRTSIPSSISSSNLDDPLEALRNYLIENELINVDVDNEMKAFATRQITDAVSLSEVASDPDPSTISHGLFLEAEPSTSVKANPRLGSDEEIILSSAINEALSDSMVDDQSVVILGEEVGSKGGVFRVTAGLSERFGSSRVIDMPLAESSMVGIGIGLALFGKRPIVEIQFADFMYAALDQIISEASKMAYRTGGTVGLPMVIRTPFGPGVRGGLYHSQSIEAMLTHVPGLKIVVPSTVQNAYDLMRAAIDDPNPVIFLEPKRGYRSIKGVRFSERPTAKIGKAEIAKSGRDLSVITYGEMTQIAVEVAEELSSLGSIEVVDLISLAPLDKDTIIDSAKRCAKVLIVHEDSRPFGIGSEISAIISEECLMDLDAPVVRLAGPHIPMMPYATSLESAATIGMDEIRSAMTKLLQS
ncbi:MAG: thiamine pyrophosphate-dependent enzyme [Actinomycetota bacterium]|nr:thiamine pyrophosphate-dependent enzyme [Actinomycetota bacterium]